MSTTSICLYYTRGYCKFGSSCRFLHAQSKCITPKRFVLDKPICCMELIRYSQDKENVTYFYTRDFFNIYKQTDSLVPKCVGQGDFRATSSRNESWRITGGTRDDFKKLENTYFDAFHKYFIVSMLDIPEDIRYLIKTHCIVLSVFKVNPIKRYVYVGGN